jgi:hypothetical protein
MENPMEREEKNSRLFYLIIALIVLGSSPVLHFRSRPRSIASAMASMPVAA